MLPTILRASVVEAPTGHMMTRTTYLLARYLITLLLISLQADQQTTTCQCRTRRLGHPRRALRHRVRHRAVEHRRQPALGVPDECPTTRFPRRGQLSVAGDRPRRYYPIKREGTRRHNGRRKNTPTLKPQTSRTLLSRKENSNISYSPAIEKDLSGDSMETSASNRRSRRR